MSRFWFSVLNLFAIMLTITLASLAAGIAYHLWVYGKVGSLSDFVAVGVLAALAYTVPIVFKHDMHKLGDVFGEMLPRRILAQWTYAFLAVVFVAFLTKTTANYSRGAVLLFFALGVAGLFAVHLGFSRLYRVALNGGSVSPRRVALVGTRDELRQWTQNLTKDWLGIRVVQRVHLPPIEDGEKAFRETLRVQAPKIRRLMVDDVVILTPLSQPARVDHCVEAFTLLPVSIHLSAGQLLDRFARVEMGYVGKISALSLTEPPLAPLQNAVKRAGDIVAALAGLILLSPVFAIVGLLIRRDGKGPVFFRQRRLGFNQKEFRIYKFRSMTTLDDGDTIVQAKAGDTRITRIGAWLRKTNIDELPQLINVLRGDMSIVGPRPHAVAHDRDYEKRILRYPRRLNVRPGITGWAQVNGYRGETDTDEKMSKRVEHDLYYIDHWSIWLDIYILYLTVFTTRAYRNAR